MTLDPNGAWSARRGDRALPRARRRARLRRRSVRRRGRLLRARGDGRIPPRHRRSHRDQHGRHRLAADGALAPAGRGRHPARRSALLDACRDRCASRSCATTWGLTWGSHSNNHFDISLAMFTHCAAAAPGQHHRHRHPLDLAGRRGAPHARAAPDRGRRGRACPTRRASASSPTWSASAPRTSSTRSVGTGARDDAMAMQYLVPGWKYDPRQPSLGRKKAKVSA